MSSTTPVSPSKNLNFSDILTAIYPAIPVLMQTAENDFGAGSGSYKMSQVISNIMTLVQIGAPLVIKNNPQHADAIAAGTQVVFNLLKATNGLNFTPQPDNKVPTKD